LGLTAFVFPGQGSQCVGMGKDLSETFPSARTLYDQAGRILGYDLADVCFYGPEATLRETRYTQPALYVHSVVVSRLLVEKGMAGEAAAGHSLGEFPALAHAGAYTFEEGLRLVQARARLMQEAADNNPGSMAAIIGLEAEDVRDLCEEAGRSGMVQPANYNAPGQIVISGTRSGVEGAIRLAGERGAKRAIPLAVSGAFHSPLMQPAAEAFGKILSGVRIGHAAVPVYANVTALPIQNPEEIREELKRQLTHPVRWIETVEKMVQDGVTRFIEVGPGKVLGGLIKRIFPEAEILSCGTVRDLERF